MNYIERIKHVAIYLRKSRNNEGEETEATLQKHKNRLLEIVQKYKWTYEIYQEVGSSMNEKRPEYIRMHEELYTGIYDAVLSVNLARVTRDDTESPKFMKLLRENDILFVTDSERIFNLEIQEDWQALKFTGFFNSWEYENIKSQLRKGKKDSAKLGRWSNGIPNYGYIYNRLTKQLEIDEDKAEGVKLAFQYVIDGMGVDNIAIELNRLGYRSNKGHYFHGNSIQRMIRSEIYKGWIVSNRVKGRNIHEGKIRPENEWIVVKDAINPHIIDEELWDLANKKLNDRKQLSPRGKQRKHGLSNLIKCHQCGKSHAISIRKDRNNTKVLQPCNKKNAIGEPCNNRGFNYNAMLKSIIEHIASRREELAEILSELQVDNSAFEGSRLIKIKKIKQRINLLENTKKKIQELFEYGDLNITEYRERKKVRSQELAVLEEELKQLDDLNKEKESNSLEGNISKLDAFLKEWDHIPDDILNQSLTTFIDKIVWYYHKESIDSPTLKIYWKEN